MSMWEEFDLENKIVAILRDAEGGYSTQPLFHYPMFMTSFQIALELERRFPKTFNDIGKVIGGKGSGTSDTLSGYLTREIFRVMEQHIKSCTDFPIEGTFLCRDDLTSLQFDKRIQPNIGPEGIAIFRIPKNWKC